MNISQWQISRGFLRLLLVCFLLWTCLYYFVFPRLASTGRPTPKERSYRRCLDYSRYVRYAATNHEFTFDVSRLSNAGDANHSEPGMVINLLFSANDLAAQGEEYWVRTHCLASKSHPKAVIVCEKGFDFKKINTSFWSLFKRNYGHAVGYSDGKVEIISAGEFAKLDLHGFTRLSQVASNALPVMLRK